MRLQSFASGKRTLMDNFDYVMHGKVRPVPHQCTPNALQHAAHLWLSYAVHAQQHLHAAAGALAGPTGLWAALPSLTRLPCLPACVPPGPRAAAGVQVQGPL